LIGGAEISAGIVSSLSCAYIASAAANCFRLLAHDVCRAFSRTCANTGNRIAAMIAITAITTSSSIKVKPARFRYIGPPPAVQKPERPRRAAGRVPWDGRARIAGALAG